MMIELDLLEMPMPMDGLSKRTRKTIAKAKGTPTPTYRQMLDYNRRWWLTWRNFGVRSLKEITDRLAQVGLELPK